MHQEVMSRAGRWGTKIPSARGRFRGQPGGHIFTVIYGKLLKFIRIWGIYGVHLIGIFFIALVFIVTFLAKSVSYT